MYITLICGDPVEVRKKWVCCDLMRACREDFDMRLRPQVYKLGLGNRGVIQLRVPSVGILIKMQTLVPQVQSDVESLHF